MATASAAGSVTATFTKVQDWGTGHEGKVTVTNGTSASVPTWRIEFDLPAGTTISSFWDADVTSSGNHYVAVKKSWAGPLAPGASFSWGYNGTGTYGGKIDAADYAGAAPYLNWLMPMTYDYFGAFNAQGPTAPHSPLYSYPGIPQQGFWADAAIQKLKAKGVPADKLLLGVGFYGRGWTGVTQTAPGGSATGPAPGTYEPGIEDYKVLKNSCPATGTVGGTAYATCGANWWSYDTPSIIGGKMTYVRNQGLGGAFFWAFSGDTGNGELIGAIKGGLG